MAKDAPSRDLGHLGLVQKATHRIIWISQPCRQIDLLAETLRQNFGIVSKRYIQLHAENLDSMIQKDILDMREYSIHDGCRMCAILVNKMAGSIAIHDFFAMHGIPFTELLLDDEDRSFRKAIIASLKLVSTPA